MTTRRFVLQASIASVAMTALPANEPVIEHEATELHILPSVRGDHPLDAVEVPRLSYRTDYDLRAGDIVVFHSRHHDWQWHWHVDKYYPAGARVTLGPELGSHNVVMTITGGTA